MPDGLVFASCVSCNAGAIFVPYVGPMGDEFHASIEEAIASGVRWESTDEGWLCPTCSPAPIPA
jgi:rubredoxin